MSKRISHLKPLLCVYLCTVLLGMSLVVQSTHIPVAMAKSNVPLMNCNGYGNTEYPPHVSSPWGTVEGEMCYQFDNNPLPSGCHGNPDCWNGGSDTSIAAGGKKAPSISTLYELEDQCNSGSWMIDASTSQLLNNTMSVASPNVYGIYHTCTISHQYNTFYQGYAASGSNGNGTAYGEQCDYYTSFSCFGL